VLGEAIDYILIPDVALVEEIVSSCYCVIPVNSLAGDPTSFTGKLPLTEVYKEKNRSK